jgi:tetratricopeptide (TPR) repeat protein
MRIFVLGLIALFLMSSLVFADTGGFKDALSFYKKGDFKHAAKYLKEYVGKNPDPYAYYLLGYASYKMKNYSESIKYFKEAYTIDPNLSPVPVKQPRNSDRNFKK